MDFDEYDYLEKMVDNPEGEKVKETTNGGDVSVKSGDKHLNRSSKHKSDDRDDAERRSKRSKVDDESREHSRHRDKVSSRHRSRSGDRDRDRRRSSKEYRGRDDRERNQEERSNKDRDVDKERERGHDRDRDSRRGRDGERDRERERDPSRRSRSESERRRGDQDESIREKSRDNEFKGREIETELKERGRDGRRYKEKKEEGTEPEADPERDQRTVFAYQICLKATERDVYEFFSKAGKVRDVRLIMDRNSRRSKGVGYVEFVDAMSVPMAIALSGQSLLGKPVMVKPSEAEKNQVQSTSAAGGPGGVMGPYSGGARRLYVGNLHPNITEDNLRQVFGAFGAVELVQLPIDESGLCKGFGFIQFSRLEDSRNALSLNGQLEIAGRTIKVSTVTDQPGAQEFGASTGDLDDEDGGGLSLNASSRAFLMQKLDRSGTASSIAGSLGAPVNNAGLALPLATTFGAAPIASSLVTPLATIPGFPGLGGGLQVPIATANLLGVGAPSECLLLKNMFDPTAESEPNFDLDIRDDVEEECSRFGKLKHIHVDKNSTGIVYLRFDNSESAMNAQRALNGRWFAGKMIGATFMDIQSYEAKFPESA